MVTRHIVPDVEHAQALVLDRGFRDGNRTALETHAQIRQVRCPVLCFAGSALGATALSRALSKLLTICGLLALGLAGLGLYGMTAYGVTLRTREIGVRMALGADRRDMLQLFVREGMRLAWRGVAWGILPAVAVTYALSGMFVGVFPVDPVTLFVSVLVLAGATLLAAYIPARRATLVDPLVALRTE